MAAMGLYLSIAVPLSEPEPYIEPGTLYIGLKKVETVSA